MKKILAISVLLIILVAIDWFKPAVCRTLDREQEELLAKYGDLQAIKSSPKTGNEKYSTPPIYSEHPKSKLPLDNSELSGIEKTDSSIASSPTVLKPFGYNLFGAPSELTPPSEVADLSEYILGPGDNIIIFLWGRVEKEYNLTVDRQGKIFIPKVGEMIVWGSTIEEFEKSFKGKVSKVYSDFEVSVSLGKIRSIRIYLTGEVKRPGAYTVSSLTTLFNALYLAGGPTERGSMRKIRLLRNNRIKTDIDLYRFLLEGDNSGDIRLSSGDAIFVPVAGPRISIGGEIKRPAIYETIGGEKISQLLKLAGGPTAEAYLDRIMLDRISPNDERQVIDINYNPKNGEIDDFESVDGDIITLFSIYEMKQNIVSIAGMVKHPGLFERTDSMTIKSLILRGELLPQNVYLKRANLFRRYSDNREEIIAVNLTAVMEGRQIVELCDHDSLHIYSIDDIKPKSFVYIDGEVKNPGEYRLYDNMSVNDLIFLAGNYNRGAYHFGIELARTNFDGIVDLMSIDLSNPDASEVLLMEDDRIYVRKRPGWLRHRMITIEGEVKFPGRYSLRSQEETLYDLIRRTGGFTESAFPRGIVFQRQSVAENLKRKNFAQIIADSQPVKEDSLGNIKKMELVRFDPERMNRIIIDIEKLMTSDGEKDNISLQGDDYIFIPKIPTGISIMGSIGINGTIKYSPNKKVKYYIERAGNFTRQADKGGTRLIKADGRAFSGGGILGKKVDVGDAIIVPMHIKKERNWLKTISTSISIIGGVVTTALIIDRL